MYTGLTGSLKIKKNKNAEYKTIAYINGWSVDNKTEIIETAKIDVMHKQTQPGARGWSASADGVIVFEDENGQKELFKAQNKGEKIKLRFHLNETTYLEGAGYIETLSMDLSAADKGNISISIRGSGELKVWLNGQNINNPDETPPEPGFKFKIKDGNLYVTVPEEENPFYMDSNGYLKLFL